MNLFLQYLKQKKGIIAIFFVFSGIFMISFLLYQLPIEAVLYPFTLCTLTGLVFLAADFYRVKRRHMLLEYVEDFTDVISGSFPQTKEILDNDYQRIIDLIAEAHIHEQNITNQRYSDMLEYYTLWVHQIKTPIASMRLHLQNEDSSLSRKLKADLLRIEQYVEMVLVYLRLDSEGSDYVIRKYDLDTIIRQAVKKFSGEFISRKLSLVYEPLHTTVITDEKWFSFVIEQIVSNALKYTTSGSITIGIQEQKLYIQDTGIGIAPEDIPRIFEKGFTGYNGRTDKKASGIGLYLCKRICNHLGHSIKAESVIDKGTTIIIDITQRKPEFE